MALAHPAKTNKAKKFFSVQDANKTLPLVRQIVGDIVRQFQIVSELHNRLAELLPRDRKRRSSDPYSEEVSHAKAELESEQEKLRLFHEELNELGIEMKGIENGLCDFPSLKDGREISLCWRLGEPEVEFWHEVKDGFAGRQPLASLAATPGSRAGSRSPKGV